MPKFLLIQTAFIGDVVLGTALAEKLYRHFPGSEIHYLVRKGNEALLQAHPFLRVLIWDKSSQKQINLLKLVIRVRSERYTHVINMHRFATSGIITALSGAPHRSGFDKNPLSMFFSRKVAHTIAAPYSPDPIHETGRNQLLIADITDAVPALPALYPSAEDESKVKALKRHSYICIAPSSVWFTKQFPPEQWMDLIRALPSAYRIYLLGGPGDKELCDSIMSGAGNPQVENLAGTLSLLQSAALMRDAVMNYVNDSGPLHFASAVGASVTAVFCSTVPSFGFGPVGDNGRVVEREDRLYCRPCGLHGYKACPEGHFKCARDIKTEQLLWWISKTTSDNA